MTKKLSIFAFAAALLVTGSAAMADEYLETTGPRNADIQNYRNVYLQDRAPAQSRNAVRSQEQAAANREFPRVDPTVGQGG